MPSKVRYQALGPLLSGEGSRAFLGLEISEDNRARPVVLVWVPEATVADEALTAKLYRETQRAAALQHPNIIRVFGLVAVEEGLARVVEFADGESLRRVLDVTGSLPPELAAFVVTEVAMGVHFAHLTGNEDGTPLVHGDIRPETVLVSFSGVCKVSGYGALSVAPREMGGKRVKGRRVHTSPEQILGGRDVATRETDVYLLGLLLYECLTGLIPFGDEPEFDKAVVSKPLKFDRPDVPPRLVGVLSKATAKRSQDRFPTALAFREAVERAMGGLPTSEDLAAYLKPFFPEADAIRAARRREIDAGIAELMRKQWEEAGAQGEPPPPPHSARSAPPAPRSTLQRPPPTTQAAPPAPARPAPPAAARTAPAPAARVETPPPAVRTEPPPAPPPVAPARAAPPAPPPAVRAEPPPPPPPVAAPEPEPAEPIEADAVQAEPGVGAGVEHPTDKVAIAELEPEPAVASTPPLAAADESPPPPPPAVTAAPVVTAAPAAPAAPVAPQPPVRHREPVAAAPAVPPAPAAAPAPAPAPKASKPAKKSRPAGKAKRSWVGPAIVGASLAFGLSGVLFGVVLPARQAAAPIAPAPSPAPAPVAQAPEAAPAPTAPPAATPAPTPPVVPAKATEPAKAPEPPSLELNVAPPVDVTIDGKPVGRSPVTVALAAGKHTIALSDPSKAIRLTRSVTVGKEGKTRHNIVIGKATVSLTAPAGSNVYMDGKLVGKAPVSDITVYEGNHLIRVMLNGAKWQQSFSVKPGDHMTFKVTETPQ